MPNGLVSPPSDDVGIVAGGGGTDDGRKKKLIIGAAAAGGLVLIYLFAKGRSKSSASASSSTAPPMIITPASNQDTATAGMFRTLSEQNSQLLAQETANQSSFTNGLSSAISAIEGAISGSQGSIISAIGSTKSVPPPPPDHSLPTLNPQDFPQIVPYGTYQPGQYTQIGTDVNGVYSGMNVGGNVPVYTNIFGGFAQGPFPKSGTYGIYIPTALTPYETTHT